MKQCNKCKEFKPLYDFYKSKATKDKLRPRCKQCEAMRLKKYNETEKGKVSKRKRAVRYNISDYGIETNRKRHLKNNYDITQEQYDALALQQNNLCAICGKPETRKKNNTDQIRYLTVDHDHKTGKVRGLLCSKCNRGLGLFDDKLESVQLILDYLSKPLNEIDHIANSM